MGIGSVALAWLLQQEQAAGRAAHAAGGSRVRPDGQAAARAGHGPGDDLAVHARRAEPRRPVRPQARADEAQRAATIPGDVVYSFANRASKKLFGIPWKFAKHGQCGTEVSELLPHLAEHRRRHRRDSLDAHRHQRPRVVDPVS